jgi:hypothetical protein
MITGNPAICTIPGTPFPSLASSYPVLVYIYIREKREGEGYRGGITGYESGRGQNMAGLPEISKSVGYNQGTSRD